MALVTRLTLIGNLGNVSSNWDGYQLIIFRFHCAIRVLVADATRCRYNLYLSAYTQTPFAYGSPGCGENQDLLPLARWTH